ncbi:MAG TPA: geranylgeranyl diphosphate synthase [candidate division Zixibacteria bacterium]|nr:geranylgeranyl diphosphate synthase [candidate division Zixibacteria bacterium]HBZ01078.1 geranylgeranyl diphosphate synthase [candidate division Zixibacteria bacterium]
MDNPDVFTLLKALKADVDRVIFDFLPSTHTTPEIDLLYRMMRDYPSRSGKGLRPGLLLLFNRAYGGNDNRALNTAAALELFQNWIVIHDDIEDQSDLRRGLPALHIKHGIPLALNAGDALAGKMWEMLLRNREILGAEKAMQIFEEFLFMYSQTTSGQHIELGWVSAARWDITEEDYFNMCRHKTAWYTVITPAWTGALIAGAPRATRDIIVRFGMDLGVAFQIQDDILNLAGDVDKYGKEIAGDLWEGKRTLVVIDLLGKCSSDERRYVLDTLNKPRESKHPEEIGEILRLIKKHESIKYAARISQALAKNARQIFTDSIDGAIIPEYRKIILNLIDFIVNREL